MDDFYCKLGVNPEEGNVEGTATTLKGREEDNCPTPLTSPSLSYTNHSLSLGKRTSNPKGNSNHIIARLFLMGSLAKHLSIKFCLT